jgi:hypothetical protein
MNEKGFVFTKKLLKSIALPNKRTLKKKTVGVKMKMKKLKNISIMCSKRKKKKHHEKKLNRKDQRLS